MRAVNFPKRGAGERRAVSRAWATTTSGLRLDARQRHGMTLLEVLVAMAIFLFGLAAISQLFNASAKEAMSVQFESRAARLAQSKLAEYIAGVQSLTSSGGGDFSDEQEPDWKWDVAIQSQGSAQGLYLVSVHVYRDVPGRGRVETNLAQYVFDPTIKGNITTQPTAPSTSTTDSSSSSGAAASAAAPSSSASSGGGGSMSSGGSSGGGKAGGGGGAAGGKSGGGGGANGGASGGGMGGARGGAAAGGMMGVSK